MPRRLFPRVGMLAAAAPTAGCSVEIVSYEISGEDNDDDNRPRSLGFLAQEVRKRFPELVREDEDGEDLGLIYDGFAALAVQAIEDQQERIENPEARLAALGEGAVSVTDAAPADDHHGVRRYSYWTSSRRSNSTTGGSRALWGQ